MCDPRVAFESREECGEYWSACSLRGRDRTRNADAWSISILGDRMGLAVADGVGALPDSPLAAEAAAAAAATWASSCATGTLEGHGSMIAAVNRAVLLAMEGHSGNGATTLASASLSRSGGVIATIGDSEVLAIGAAGPAERLNELDHVPSRPNVLLGWIDGHNVPQVHVVELSTLPYRLCFVTDGVTAVLDYARIAEIVRSVSANHAARALIAAAQAAGAQDDASAIVHAGRARA